MTEEIRVRDLDKKELRKVWLKIILHFFAQELQKENRTERSKCLATGAYALDYLIIHFDLFPPAPVSLHLSARAFIDLSIYIDV